MVYTNGGLWLFGGSNGTHTLNDMWKFDLTSKQWSKLETKDTPDVGIFIIVASKRSFYACLLEIYLYVWWYSRHNKIEKRCLYISN